MASSAGGVGGGLGPIDFGQGAPTPGLDLRPSVGTEPGARTAEIESLGAGESASFRLGSENVPYNVDDMKSPSLRDISKADIEITSSASGPSAEAPRASSFSDMKASAGEANEGSASIGDTDAKAELDDEAGLSNELQLQKATVKTMEEFMKEILEQTQRQLNKLG